MRIKLEKNQREMVIEDIQAYFETQRSESIGELAADHLLVFMMERLGHIIYNEAIKDCQKVILEQTQRLEDELYALEKPVQGFRPSN
jgi:uncharacterized protein (DUF2164 family)